MKYSQNNEQDYILNYFGKYKGCFLDLGAYTGVELSNTRELAEIGWSGVMVEASPTVFYTLEKNYAGFKKISLHNCAVGASTGPRIFYDNAHAVGTLHEQETKRWGQAELFNKIKIPCIEINEFLAAIPQKTFDLVTIDIEGEDYATLRRMNLKSLSTRMLLVEWNSKDRYLYDEIMLPQGFKLLHTNTENLIYTI